MPGDPRQHRENYPFGAAPRLPAVHFLLNLPGEPPGWLVVTGGRHTLRVPLLGARRSPDESSFGACGQADIEQTAYFWRRECAAPWHKGRRCALVGRQVVADRVAGRVGFAAGADLGVDVRDMPRDRALAQDKLARYFRVCMAGRNKA